MTKLKYTIIAPRFGDDYEQFKSYKLLVKRLKAIHKTFINTPEAFRSPTCHVWLKIELEDEGHLISQFEMTPSNLPDVKEAAMKNFEDAMKSTISVAKVLFGNSEIA
jgi:hypothetical protein